MSGAVTPGWRQRAAGLPEGWRAAPSAPSGQATHPPCPHLLALRAAAPCHNRRMWCQRVRMTKAGHLRRLARREEPLQSPGSPPPPPPPWRGAALGLPTCLPSCVERQVSRQAREPVCRQAAGSTPFPWAACLPSLLGKLAGDEVAPLMPSNRWAPSILLRQEHRGAFLCHASPSGPPTAALGSRTGPNQC